jgi:hypothetical protein
MANQFQKQPKIPVAAIRDALPAARWLLRARAPILRMIFPLIREV